MHPTNKLPLPLRVERYPDVIGNLVSTLFFKINLFRKQLAVQNAARGRWPFSTVTSQSSFASRSQHILIHSSINMASNHMQYQKQEEMKF